MKYSELEDELKKINNSYYFVKLLEIDKNLVDIFGRFIKYGDYPNQLFIEKPKFIKLSNDRMILEGIIDLPTIFSKTHFYVQFVFINTDKIDFIVGIQPRPKDNWLNEVGNEIRRLYDNIPVKITADEVVYIYSSLAKRQIPIKVFSNREFKTNSLDIQKDISLLIQVEIDILSIIKLKDNWFHISNIDLQNINISKKVNYTINLTEHLETTINKVQIISSQILEIDTNVNLNFPNGNVSLEPKFTLTKDNYKAQVSIPHNNLPIDKILPNLNIGKLEASIEGNFQGTNSPIYGFFGSFSIGNEKLTTKSILNYDYSFSSLDDYVFYVKFRPDTNGYYPIFLQAYLKEISLSKIINVVSDVNLDIPSFLEPITFFNTYIYYCDPSYNSILIDGTTARKGSAVSSGISFLGIKGYAFYEAFENGLKGEFLLQPLEIPGIIEIGGNGTQSPDNWNGQGFESGGASFSFEMGEDTLSLSGNLNIKFLNIVEANGIAKYNSSKGLYLEFGWNIFNLEFNLKTYINAIDNFYVEGDVNIPILKIDINLNPVGRIKIDLSVATLFNLTVKNKNISTDFDCTIKISGKKYPLATFAFDLNDLENLEDVILEKVENLLEDIFKSALDWLLGIANGIIEIAEDIAERLKIIGEALKDYFEAGFEEAARLLTDAKYILNDTINILENTYKESVEKLIDELNNLGHSLSAIGQSLLSELNVKAEEFANAINKLGISPEKLMEALKNGYGLLKDKASQLMKNLQYGINDIAKSLESVFKLKPKDIAKVLDTIGYGASDIGNVLNEVWNIGESRLRDILGSIGHAGDVIGDVVGDIFGGGGSCLMESFDLAYSSITKFEKERFYKLLLLRKYRDEYLANITEGKNLLKVYNDLSEKVNSLNNNEVKSRIFKTTYFNIIITLVAQLEKSGFENSIASIDFAYQELDKLNIVLVNKQ